MRIAVIADIHGNFRALEAVLEDIDRSAVDHIFSLGDNIGYGPEPEEVVRVIMDRGVVSVLGNHELAIREASYRRRLNPASRESIEITGRLMSRETIDYSCSLPLNVREYDALFVHGSPPTSAITYLWSPSETKLGSLFRSYGEAVCFHGHTHNITLYSLREAKESRQEDAGIGVVEAAADRRYLLNPGSVGQPRDGINNRAKYLIWDLGAKTFEFRAIAYDVQATVELIRKRGFPEFNAIRLLW